MPQDNLKRCLFEQLASIGKSLGHANRLLILDILAQGPSSVEVLSQKLDLSVANVSKHLQQLKNTHLVVSDTHGTQRIYRLSDPQIIPLIQSLRKIAENQMAEVSDILHQKLQPRAPLMPFNPKQLKSAVQSNRVTLLDVRPSDEYQAGHIEGAINIPIEELDQQMTQIPHDKPVVVYCRGPYCLWSYDAVETLNQGQHEASRLPMGYPDWKQG